MNYYRLFSFQTKIPWRKTYSIKRLNNKLFINVCLFIPNQKLKNFVSEYKNIIYYYEDIIKLVLML